MSTWRKNAWVPELRGATYCSPACGASCTLNEYNHVTAMAQKLARTMGRGWTVEVHENMGWYYGIRKGPARISANVRRGAIKRGEARVTYSCTISIPGISDITATTLFPQDCYHQVLVIARGQVRTISEALATLTKED